MSPSRWSIWRGRILRLWLASATSAVGALGGLARNKWLAMHLAPAGMGVIGQVGAAQIWLGTLVGLGLGVPLARAIGAAVARDDAAAIRRTVSTAMAALWISTLAVGLLGLLFAAPLSVALLGTAEHADLVRIAMLGVAGIGFQGTLLGVFAGHSDVRAPLTFAIVGNVVTVAAVLFAVPRFGLVGATWSVALFWPVAAIGALLVHRRAYAPVFGSPFAARFHRAEGLDLLKVAATALTLALLDQGMLLALRAHYLRASGLAANGLFQSALAIAQQLGALFYTYLSGYAFGRISGAAGVTGVRDYTRRQFAPLVALAALTFGVAMLASGPLLHLLYSNRFDPARPMLGWMMVGEFARVALLTWSLGALPLGGVRLWAGIGLANTALLGIGYVVAQALGAGAMSLPYAYAGGTLGALAIAAFRMTRRGVSLRAADLALLLGAVAALALLAGSRGR